ncbi:hypothetical protein KCU67_g8, partial [Aureobasidium melanogenum]
MDRSRILPGKTVKFCADLIVTELVEILVNHFVKGDFAFVVTNYEFLLCFLVIDMPLRSTTSELDGLHTRMHSAMCDISAFLSAIIEEFHSLRSLKALGDFKIPAYVIQNARSISKDRNCMDLNDGRESLVGSRPWRKTFIYDGTQQQGTQWFTSRRSSRENLISVR